MGHCTATSSGTREPRPKLTISMRAMIRQVKYTDAMSLQSDLHTVGQLLCRNGKVSNRDCQRVRKINDCCWKHLCNLVQMEHHLSAYW